MTGPRPFRFRAHAAALCLALALPAGALAQSGNQSDVSGALPSGASTGGAPPGSGSALPASTPEGRAALRSLLLQLEQGDLGDLGDLEGGGAEAQASLMEMFLEGVEGEAGRLLSQALISGCIGQNGSCAEAATLMDAVGEFIRLPSATALSWAIDTFNAHVAQAPEPWLNGNRPPNLFLALHVTLSYLRAHIT